MHETGRADPNAPRGWGWVIGMLVLFVVLVWPAILAGGGGTSQANDMVDYHAIEIRRLAAQWPTPDLRESFTTTTPGFHLVLAVVAKLGGGLLVQRLVASVAGLLAWLVTWRMAAAWCSARVAAVLAAPVALSPYLLGATVWMTTDAAALALAAATMGVALVARNEVRMSRVAGLLGAGTVLVRQIMLWASVPAALRVLFDRARDVQASWPARAWRLTVVLVPPVACVGAFFAMWGGSMPPRFQPFHQAVFNPAAMVMLLATLGCWGALVLPGVWMALDRRARVRCVLVSVIAMAMCAAVRSDWRKVLPPDEMRRGTVTEHTWGPTAPDVVKGAGEVGRWGGPIWEVARALPAPSGRSLAMIALAGVGALVVTALRERAARIGHAWPATLLLAAVLCMGVAQCLNAQTFQRYFDPWALLAVGWLVAMGQGVDSRSDRWSIRGAALLAALQLGMSAAVVFKPAFMGAPLAG